MPRALPTSYQVYIIRVLWLMFSRYQVPDTRYQIPDAFFVVVGVMSVLPTMTININSANQYVVRNLQTSSIYCKSSLVWWQRFYVPSQVSFFGAMNMLGLAKRVNARILQASTSEVRSMDGAGEGGGGGLLWDVCPVTVEL